MRQFIKDKAAEAGVPHLGGGKDLSGHFDALKVDISAIEDEGERRAAKVKNISLRLLGVNGPQAVLDIFEEEFIIAPRETDGVKAGDEATTEELFMFLYFFKTQIRDMNDADG